jgi:hypothetical protein
LPVPSRPDRTEPLLREALVLAELYMRRELDVLTR